MNFVCLKPGFRSRFRRDRDLRPTHSFAEKTATKGFTLIELIVVIVVISILATVTIIGFGSWRTSVAAKEVHSDLSLLASAMDSAKNFSTDTDSGYPIYPPGTVFDGNDVTKGLFKSSNNVRITYVSGDRTTYCVEAHSLAVSSVVFFLDKSNGGTVSEGTCAGGSDGSPGDDGSGDGSGDTGGGGDNGGGDSGSSGKYVVSTSSYVNGSNLVDVAPGPSGSLYVAETNRIMKVSSSGDTSTFVGTTAAGSTNGSGTNARFNSIFDIDVAADGTIYVADTSNNRIRKVTPSGVVSTYAGSSSGYVNGSALSARFHSPSGLGIAPDGTIYVADTNNFTIRKISTSGTVSTLAGDPTEYGSRDCKDGTGLAAMFNTPYDIAVSADGTLYAIDYGCANIRKITASGVVTTYAGDVGGIRGHVDATGTSARFQSMYAIAIDSSGSLYLTDSGNAAIRKISPSREVTTLAGSTAGYRDGDAGSAQFAVNLEGIAIGDDGTIYVADRNNAKVRIIKWVPN